MDGQAAGLGLRRSLVVNERGATVVRHIFRRFVELGSSTLLVKDPSLDGVTSKTWTTQDGRVCVGDEAGTAVTLYGQEKTPPPAASHG
jgi:hypothetical protein